MPTFNGSEGNEITLSEGHNLTENFQTTYPTFPIAQYLGSDFLKKLLAVDGAVGIRFYNGMDTEGNIKLVCVAVDEDDIDLLSVICDNTFRTPPFGASAANYNALNNL